jgi:riboflavin biosynthesis pyrimidine reductase
MKRARVIVCQQASIDGKLAISPDVLLLYGDERWVAISGTSEFDLFEWLKTTHQPQATLEGSGSLVREGDRPEPLPPVDGDPSLLYDDHLPEAALRRPDHRGWFMLVDGRGRVRNPIKEGAVFGEAWRGWHLLVFVAHQTPAEYLAHLQQLEIPYLVAGESRVDLQRALEKVRSLLGVETLISTAGGQLNGALLRAGLVDEINVEYLPAVIGGRHTPTLFDAPSLKAGEWPVHLELISAQVQTGGRVWLRYRVLRQPQPSTAKP